MCLELLIPWDVGTTWDVGAPAPMKNEKWSRSSILPGLWDAKQVPYGCERNQSYTILSQPWENCIHVLLLETWVKKQTTSNIGFDAQLKDNLSSLTAELFYNKRSDILTERNASVPGFTGLELPDENIAEVDNRGFEVDGGYHQKIYDAFRFDITANFS